MEASILFVRGKFYKYLGGFSISFLGILIICHFEKVKSTDSWHKVTFPSVKHHIFWKTQRNEVGHINDIMFKLHENI